MASRVIVSCAVTGAIHTPSMSDHLPITPEQIARSSIEATQASVAIIHLHARDPETGAPTPDPAVFMRFQWSSHGRDHRQSRLRTSRSYPEQTPRSLLV
jgi:uncharacterized protein (DUF849 family)